MIAAFAFAIRFRGRIRWRDRRYGEAFPYMHWYYRVDRTSNRHCWYLQPAGMQVRSHEIAPLSKPVPAQIVPEQSLAASEKVDLQTLPLQAAAAEDVRIELSEPSIGAPSAAHFNARWSHAPASVDFGYDFASSRRGTAAEQASLRPEEVMLSTRVSPDTVSPSLHKSRNPVKLGLLFIAGAISAILFATLLKLARVLCSFRTRPRLKSELDHGSEISLSELMRALRRIDQSLKATEAQRYPAPKHVSSSQTREQQNEIIIIGPQLPPLVRGQETGDPMSTVRRYGNGGWFCEPALLNFVSKALSSPSRIAMR
jgi:hypothetical protein